jgi:acetyl esterase/lipase
MASEPAFPPVYPTPLPLFQRLKYALRLNFAKFLIKNVFRILNLPFLRDKSIQPTFTKIYPCQPTLINRVFIPKSYKSDDALLPLYLDIHGGGFALGSPWADDKICSNFSNKNKILVISLDYPKAPQHRYPAAVNAIIDLVNAVLDDDSLPFDRKKVAIGGASAGANLSLAVTQDESLQGRVGGVVSYYGLVDFSTPLEVQLASRPKNAGQDLLEYAMGMFKWAYVKPDQNLREPRLSVRYAAREKLPPKICFFGCELDLLCRDAEIMAEEVAGGKVGERVGSDDCWEKNGVQWEKILWEEHGMWNYFWTFWTFWLGVN